MNQEPEDLYVPPDATSDGKDIDYNRQQAAFAQTKKRVFEAAQAEVVEQYEAKVEGREKKRDANPENDTLIINGIAIPPVSVGEPEYLLEREKVQDAPANGVVNMPFGSSDMYQKRERPNPNYMSREMRNALILEAQQAMENTQIEMVANDPKTIQKQEAGGYFKEAPLNDENIASVNFMSRVMNIQQQLQNENIVGFEMKDGHLVITLE